EHDNLRAALEWLIQAGGAEKAWSLAGALYPFWSLRGYFGEARALLERAVDVGRDRPEVAASRARGKVLHVTGRLVQMTDPERARELYLESLGLARARRDEINTAIALDNLGEVEYEQRALEAASQHLEEGLAIQRRIGHRQGEAESLWALGNVARETGDHPLASRRYD